MNAFDFALFVVKTFFLSHLVLFAFVIGIAVIVLSIVFLGAGPAILAFLRSRIGQIIIALIVAGTAGWELRSYVDDSVELQRQIAAERKATATKLAAANAAAALNLSVAVEARRQALAATAVNASAASRADNAEREAATLQAEMDRYDDELAAKEPKARYPLTDADVRGLCRIGSCPAARRAR